MEKKERASVIRAASAEGVVLLKNDDGVLPIKKEESIAVFGRCQIDTYRSGTGSGGAVNVPYSVNLIDGIRAAGISVNETLAAAYRAWVQENPFDNGGGGWAAEPWYQKDMPLTVSLVSGIRRECGKAVYIIGRTAGEDKDNANERGSYLLTEQEEENLALITDSFRQVIVILNVSNVIDMKWLRDERYQNHIKGVLYVWQGGMETGNGVADVLSGKVTPSGKLPDTIAWDISQYPSTINFGQKEKNIYQEDIYVGYRYFETFHPEYVMYEFGYGLSYTDFRIEVTETETDEERVCHIRGRVTNIGNHYAGKEVVQLYYEPPQGKLGKPVRNLGAFLKTGLLQPGESEMFSFVFPAERMASYDESGRTGYASCYVMEEGGYGFYVGNSVRNAKRIENFCYYEPSVRVVKTLCQAAAPKEAFLVLKPGAVRADGTYEEIWEPVTLSQTDMEERIQKNLPCGLPVTGDKGIVFSDVKKGTHTMNEFISQLTVPELAVLVRGEGMSHPLVTTGTASAFGGVSERLRQYGIPLVCCADGPSGLRMEKESSQVPIGTQLASSWNEDLVEKVYRLVGTELAENEVDILLGPGLNIHRNPLNGRNFEYYSEDPYLTGVMAGTVIKALASKGVLGTLKHFALNNQEACRHAVNSVCSERAIREIYIKGFEIAVTSGIPAAVMTSYNPVNGHWAASAYDLVNTILRREWGFEGLVMTDWWAAMNDVVCGGESSDKDIRDMIRSGNDVYMVVNNDGAEINSNQDNTIESVEKGSLTAGELQAAAYHILRAAACVPASVRKQKEEMPVTAYEPAGQAPEGTVYPCKGDAAVQIRDGQPLWIKVEQEGVYTVIVSVCSYLSNLSQSTTNLLLNKETMAVVQNKGTEGKRITKKAAKIALKEGYYEISFCHVSPGLVFDEVRFLQ